MTKIGKPSSISLSNLSRIDGTRRGGGRQTIIREDLRGIPAGETRLKHAVSMVVKDQERYWYIYNYLVNNKPLGDERERW